MANDVSDESAGETGLDEKPEAADPFAEFEDWLKDGPAGKWPFSLTMNYRIKQNDAQKRVVVANAELLLNRDEWHQRVDRFETALRTIDDEAERRKRRQQYIINFDKHTFPPGDHEFNSYRFPCSVSFRETQFGDGKVSFSFSTFDDGDVWFDRAVFGNGEVWFAEMQFGNGVVWFPEAAFGDGGVFFIGTKFGNGSVLFDRARFGKGDVQFQRAEFGDGHVTFIKAQFGSGDVSFKGAQFGVCDVVFSGAHFGYGTVGFIDTQFKRATVSAVGMSVSENLQVSADFGKQVDFRHLTVGGTADFSGSTFAEVPDFRDAKLDRPPEVARMVVPSPKLTRQKWRQFKIAAEPENVIKYRKLKAMALAANDHEKDGEFFSYEMLAKRGVETKGFFPLLFNMLYHQLGNFGQSYLRPLAWMGASWFGFAFVYSAIIDPADHNFQNKLFALVYSARKAVLPVDALFRSMPTSREYVPWFDRMFAQLAREGVNMDLIGFVGMGQSLFGGVLLFLLLLGLRNKFRLK